MRLSPTELSSKRNQSGKSRSARSASVEKAATGPATPFIEILNNILPPDDVDSYDLNVLWSELPGAERRLLDSPGDENLTVYRDIVKRIAAATLKKNVRVKKLKRKNRRGETVELSVIEIIDERLQKMALLMHSGRNSAFALLKTAEEIRGLLLDIRN